MHPVPRGIPIMPTATEVSTEINRARRYLEECSHTLDGSKAILKQLGYSDSEIGGICQWFELNGGYCDCEVVMNVVMRDRKEYQ